MGYNHPVLNCPVGAPLHVIRKMAYDMYESTQRDTANLRIHAKSGFSGHSDDTDLPRRHLAAFQEARNVSTKLAATTNFENGTCPDFGAALNPLGRSPLRESTVPANVRVICDPAIPIKLTIWRLDDCTDQPWHRLGQEVRKDGLQGEKPVAEPPCLWRHR